MGEVGVTVVSCQVLVVIGGWPVWVGADGVGGRDKWNVDNGLQGATRGLSDFWSGSLDFSMVGADTRIGRSGRRHQ
jgi:hypothetical protein